MYSFFSGPPDIFLFYDVFRTDKESTNNIIVLFLVLRSMRYVKAIIIAISSAENIDRNFPKKYDFSIFNSGITNAAPQLLLSRRDPSVNIWR